MQNFNLLDNTTIQLPTGVFAGVESYNTYSSGELSGIRLAEKNMLVTHVGEIVPVYTETHRRKEKYAVEFYKTGMIKAIAFDEQQEVQTPIGEFPAELVTFFDTGELKRFFPLDGKISGLWSETEEKSYAIPLTFDLPFTQFTAIISGIALYKSGNIRSVTLFPDEEIMVQTTSGKVAVRNGFSLYESGELESIEPLEPVKVKTPIGVIAAFDSNAVGINADNNSLRFDKEGRVLALTTVSNRIVVQTENGRLLTFSPREVINPLDDETLMTEGLIITFDYEEGAVVFEGDLEKSIFAINKSGFTVTRFDNTEHLCSPMDCASCSLGCK